MHACILLHRCVGKEFLTLTLQLQASEALARWAFHSGQVQRSEPKLKPHVRPDSVRSSTSISCVPTVLGAQPLLLLLLPQMPPPSPQLCST